MPACAHVRHVSCNRRLMHDWIRRHITAKNCTGTDHGLYWRLTARSFTPFRSSATLTDFGREVGWFASAERARSVRRTGEMVNDGLPDFWQAGCGVVRYKMMREEKPRPASPG